MPKATASQLQILPQIAMGTAATGWALAPRIPFRSESINANSTSYGSQAIRNTSQRDKDLARKGTVDVSGGLDLEATNISLAAILPLTFPNKTEVVFATGTGKNVIYTPGVAETPYASVKINDSEKSLVFVDMQVGQLSFNSEVDQLVTMSVDLTGRSVNISNETNAGGQSITNEYGLYFEQATVTIGVTEVDVRSFSLQISRNLVTDRWKLGSKYRRSIPAGVYDITGSVTLDANSVGDAKYLYETALTTNSMAIKLVFVDPTNEVDTDTGPVPSKFVISIPCAMIDWPDHHISGEGFIEGAINFTSYAASTPAAVVADTLPTDQFSIQHVYQPAQ